MTCIVGFVHNGTVCMGGDSAGVAGYDLRIRKDEKVFVKGEFIFGYTTSFRMGQLIRFKFNPPEQPSKMDAFEYMCTLFVDELRKCLKEGGFAEVSNNKETGGFMLVGYRGKLYRIESDFQVAIPAEDYDAVGCGANFALGALKILYYMALPVPEMIRKALEVAEEFSAGVRRPFVIKMEGGIDV